MRAVSAGNHLPTPASIACGLTSWTINGPTAGGKKRQAEAKPRQAQDEAMLVMLQDSLGGCLLSASLSLYLSLSLSLSLSPLSLSLYLSFSLSLSLSLSLFVCNALPPSLNLSISENS